MLPIPTLEPGDNLGWSPPKSEKKKRRPVGDDVCN
jgi:hypothetical protein